MVRSISFSIFHFPFLICHCRKATDDRHPHFALLIESHQIRSLSYLNRAAIIIDSEQTCRI